MSAYSWVTLATNDSYSLGALVLGHSLRRVGTAHQLTVLVTPGVTSAMRNQLSTVFSVIQEVNVLDSQDEANLALMSRPELGVTFTKLHCWRLTQFTKCVFLDADTLVLQNCDELFDREELSAAPDVGWPDCFNSGVFVYRPSNDTFKALTNFAVAHGSFDGGDQGLLNQFFSDWASKDISRHLPFIYNMCSTATYSYLPAFKQFGERVKIVHFLGVAKPWLQYLDSETRQVRPSPGSEHLHVLLQLWWDIFCSLVHPTLSPEMAGLAGALAQLTLGAPRSAEQTALEEHLRRQAWEQGNADYMGRDSFDNIWRKICETLAQAPQRTAEAPPPAENMPALTAPSTPPPLTPVPAPVPHQSTVPAQASPQEPAIDEMAPAQLTTLAVSAPPPAAPATPTIIAATPPTSPPIASFSIADDKQVLKVEPVVPETPPVGSAPVRLTTQAHQPGSPIPEGLAPPIKPLTEELPKSPETGTEVLPTSAKLDTTTQSQPVTEPSKPTPPETQDLTEPQKLPLPTQIVEGEHLMKPRELSAPTLTEPSAQPPTQPEAEAPSAKPASESTKPASEPTKPIAEAPPAKAPTESTKPAAEPTKPIAEAPPAKPSAEPTKPIAEAPPAKPAAEPTKPIAEAPPAKPTAEPTKPIAEAPPTKPAAEPTKPIAETPPAKAPVESTKPEAEAPPAKPAVEPTKPIAEAPPAKAPAESTKPEAEALPAKPAAEPTKPIAEAPPAKPAAEPTKPIAEAPPAKAPAESTKPEAETPVAKPTAVATKAGAEASPTKSTTKSEAPVAGKSTQETASSESKDAGGATKAPIPPKRRSKGGASGEQIAGGKAGQGKSTKPNPKTKK